MVRAVRRLCLVRGPSVLTSVLQSTHRNSGCIGRAREVMLRFCRSNSHRHRRRGEQGSAPLASSSHNAIYRSVVISEYSSSMWRATQKHNGNSFQFLFPDGFWTGRERSRNFYFCGLFGPICPVRRFCEIVDEDNYMQM